MLREAAILARYLSGFFVKLLRIKNIIFPVILSQLGMLFVPFVCHIVECRAGNNSQGFPCRPGEKVRHALELSLYVLNFNTVFK